MSTYCTLENEMYKYSYGNFNPWKVPFLPDKSISLTCAGNDCAAFQLLLYSKEEFMAVLDRSPALFKAWPVNTFRAEVRIPGFTPSVSFVEGVRDDDGNYKSEILLSDRSKYVEKLRVQPVYIELCTEPDMVPGLYQGSVNIYESRLFGDETLLSSLNFDLTVLTVNLPDLWESSFHLTLWQHHTSIARTYEVPLFGDAHFALMDTYLKELEALGEKSITAIVSEAPWSGQWSAYYRTNPSDCFEYNMITVKKDKAGCWHYNFDVLNRYISLCLSHHIDREIEIYGLAGIWVMEDAGIADVVENSNDAVRIRYYDEEKDCMCYIRKLQELDQYMLALADNLKQNGWEQMARICCDEPSDKEAFQQILLNMQRLLPDIKLKVTICSMEVLEADYPQITDYVLNLPLIMQNPDRISALRKKKNCTFSYYTAIDPPHPNTFLNCHPAEARFLPWLSFLLDMDGYLRWAVWLWPDRPFDYESYHYQKFRAGGTHFLYPGKNGTPLQSLRYKQLKKGLRDYLILQTYRNKMAHQADGDITAKMKEQLESILKKPLESLSTCSGADEFLSLNQEDYDRLILFYLEQLTGMEDSLQNGRYHE